MSSVFLLSFSFFSFFFSVFWLINNNCPMFGYNIDPGRKEVVHTAPEHYGALL